MALPDLLSAVGGATEVVDVGNAFDDPENDRLAFSVASGNSAVARVSVREGIVRVTPRSAGTVTVTASDPSGASADRSFSVDVEAPALQRPTISIDGSFLVFEFTDTFTANEARAYELQLTPPGRMSSCTRWATFSASTAACGDGTTCCATRPWVTAACRSIQHRTPTFPVHWRSRHSTPPAERVTPVRRYPSRTVPGRMPIATVWRRSVLGRELMATGIHTSGVNPLSAITIEALADLGYDVDPSQADAYVLPSNAPPRDTSPGTWIPLQCRMPGAQGAAAGGVLDTPILFRMTVEP